MSAAWIVFRKEVRDGLRDTRSLFSAVTFCWMGPLLVGLLWRFPAAPTLLPAFLMITAFTGAMNVANDIMAGEKERGSLEPLLLNPVSPADLALGKFLATCAFSLGCVLLTLLCSLVVLATTPLGSRIHASLLAGMLGVMLPLAPFAAAVDLLICAFAATQKEGSTHLSIALLAPMLTGILAEFFPVRVGALVAATPLLGQQRMLSALTRAEIPELRWILLSWTSSVLIAVIAIRVTARLLGSEKVILGK
jgi:sodium transport system permease protein